MAAFEDNFSAWFDGLELKAIGPTSTLAETRDAMPASSLKMEDHFSYKEDAGGILNIFKENFKSQLERLEEEQSNCEAVVRESAMCIAKIYSNCFRLLSSDTCYSNRIKNEATLRFVLGDPIMVMICNAGNLKVR